MELAHDIVEARFDPARLVGADLVQVCFGHHELHLNFDNSVRIGVESAFRVVLPDGTDLMAFDVPEDEPVNDAAALAAATVSSLLRMVVTQAELSGEGKLTVHFDQGAIVELYSLRRLYPLPFPYESYQVTIGGEVFVA